jgi:hypothetical protein
MERWYAWLTQVMSREAKKMTGILNTEPKYKPNTYERGVPLPKRAVYYHSRVV